MFAEKARQVLENQLSVVGNKKDFELDAEFNNDR